MARTKESRNEIVGELRPIAINLIKEALRVYHTVERTLTEAGEEFEDLVTEARAEVKKGKPSRRDKRHKGKS
jgi:hypothetical protein